MANATGTFVAATSGADFVANAGTYNNAAQFNVTVYGTFVGTVVLEASFDGVNYVPVNRYCTGNAVSYTAPANEVLPAPEGGVKYRLRCSAYTSGTVSWRLSA